MENQVAKSRRTRWPIRLVLIILAMILAIIVYIAAFAWLPAAVTYQITEQYNFSGPEGARVALGVLLPVDRPYQAVDDLGISWDGWQDHASREHVDVVTFMGEIDPGTEKTATLSYRVTLNQGPSRWPAPSVEADLLPQPNIESDDLSIRANAETLAPKKSREDALRIHRFVAGVLSLSSGPRDCTEPPSAATALSSGRGGCGEDANLMVALSRAADIPARVIQGVAFPSLSLGLPQSSQTRTAAYPGIVHTWVEFSTQGNWSMADPAWALPGRTLFGSSDAAHLSYGEIATTQQTLAAVRGWFAVVGHEISAMTMPPKFVASADLEGVNITPVVTVQKGWDIRWLYLLGGLLLVVLAFILLDGLLVRRRPLIKAEAEVKGEENQEQDEVSPDRADRSDNGPAVVET